MAAQNNAFGAAVLRDCTLELRSQVESRPLPWQPNHLAPELTVKFFQLFLAVCAGSEGDGPVGMEVVHMIERKEGVQRRIYGSSNLVLAKGRKRIVTDHLIFVGFTAV